MLRSGSSAGFSGYFVRGAIGRNVDDSASICSHIINKNAVPPPAADFVTELLSRYASRRLASSSVQPPYVQQRRSCGAPLRNRTASWLDARSACLTPKPSVSPSPRRGFLLYPNVSFSGRAAPAARHSFLFGCAQPLDHLEFRASRLSLSQLKSMA